MTEEESGKLI